MNALFPFYAIGHFINQPANPTQFEITRFDTMDEPDVDDIHKHTFYEIIWIERGESRQVIDYQEYAMRANSLFFISPGQLHSFEEWKPVTGGTIMFTADFFLLNHSNPDRLFELSFLDNFYANPCLLPDPDSYAEIKHTIDLLVAEHRRADRSLPICQSLLHVLLHQVQRSINTQTGQAVSKRYFVIYKNFRNLVDAHFLENSTASTYAARLNITPHHLNEVTKRITGKTATEVIRSRSILEAKRLLTFTDQSVAEVAARLNYFDGSYFAKLFKAEVGLSPTAFKASAQAIARGKSPNPTQ
ncbi:MULTISPECIES: helix-turn-helix domain-containing protein [Spirosoma]|nr:MULTISPECIES: helix-turn-helix transcriptional regulator [Spirosoma]